jgi:hypothetical protein
MLISYRIWRAIDPARFKSDTFVTKTKATITDYNYRTRYLWLITYFKWHNTSQTLLGFKPLTYLWNCLQITREISGHLTTLYTEPTILLHHRMSAVNWATLLWDQESQGATVYSFYVQNYTITFYVIILLFRNKKWNVSTEHCNVMVGRDVAFKGIVYSVQQR